jgi:hypothetical protein
LGLSRKYSVDEKIPNNVAENIKKILIERFMF